jgi:hypothetical protein
LATGLVSASVLLSALEKVLALVAVSGPALMSAMEWA